MILAIDATNWMHQLWHAQPGPGALGMFAGRMQALTEGLTPPPSAVVACFDRASFRAALYPAYKAGRQPRNPELADILVEAEISASQFATIATQDGYEADDGLASLAQCGLLLDQKVILASPDKDIRQALIPNRVTILRGFTVERGKPTRMDWYTASALSEKYGLRPDQWPSYQALVGDKGDNIPGCPGWGDVTARAALQREGTLQRCLANAWNLRITPRQRTALLQFPAALMLDLTTLRIDMDAAWDALR